MKMGKGASGPGGHQPGSQSHPEHAYLLSVSLGKRQLCGDMEHDLPVPEYRVH